MIFKILIFAVVAFLIYKFFFNKKNKIEGDDTKQIEEELVSCPTCGMYLSKDDAILSSGKHYCSEKCLPR